MSRHNRRRTRGGHKSGSSNHPGSIDLSVEPPLPPDVPLQPTNLGGKPNARRRNAPSARHWHNRYMAWQARDRRQREEIASLEAEKKRLFGDIDEGYTSSEDDQLCQKMLEYFVGLDFIDP